MKIPTAFFVAVLIVVFPECSFTQNIDTTKVYTIGSVEIAGERKRHDIQRMSDVEGNIIASGKKNEIVDLKNSMTDLTGVNARQLFARVPGIMVWESDGSGIQMGIAARGLSPNRSWEFNMRQNGHDIAPDVFGYPESYYTPPMEALSRIDVVRGAASLQFGPQFGGMVNYVFKNGEGERKLFYEGRQTAGSFHLLNSYNALGGQVGKLSYYGCWHQRSAEGWRENSRYNTTTGYASVQFHPSENLLIGLSYTRADFLSQQAGGLTDEDFNNNARQSHRSRNWFSAPWNVASFNLNWKYSAQASLDVKAFGILAERNSVGFMKAINIADTLNASTGEFNPRQIDRDNYESGGVEVRNMIAYRLLGKTQHLAIGGRFYACKTGRRQSASGSTGVDFDLTNGGSWSRSLAYTTTNYAAFAENLFHLSDALCVTSGVRIENITSTSAGMITITAGEISPLSRERWVILSGLGVQYDVASTNFYANYSQSFRPVTYSELTPAATNDVIDPNLKDASGYNIDAGYRGNIRNWLHFDAGVFYLYYNDRIGTVNLDGINHRMNIGTSVSKGVEAYVEFDPVRLVNPESRYGFLSLFASLAWIDARYTRWDNDAIVASNLTSIEGKRVENAPEQVHRFGVKYEMKKFVLESKLNYTGEVFTDAANTSNPSANGQNGRLNTYAVMDCSAAYRFNEQISFQIGVNNLTDERYATRRAGGYPGPGLLPGNARSGFASLDLKF